MQTDKNILLFPCIQMFFLSGCCAAGGSSEQGTNAGHNTEVRVCVYRFAYELNSCIYDTTPLLLCRRIMEITTTRRYRHGTSRQAQETRCRPFMPSSTLPQTSSTMPASISRRTLSVSRQMGTHFLT